MSDLRKAAQMALEALIGAGDDMDVAMQDAFVALRAALAQPEQEPLTEDEIELAYQEVWRSLPSDFSYTSYNWIEQGIRYAEQLHGIGVE